MIVQLNVSWKEFQSGFIVVPMINYKSNKGKNVGGPDFTNFNHNPQGVEQIIRDPCFRYRNIFQFN